MAKTPEGVVLNIVAPTLEPLPVWTQIVMPTTISFITQSQYEWMSNFHQAPFIYEGKSWYTVEHAFQAAKVNFFGEWAKKIRVAATPTEAKHLGRKCPLRKDWELVKVDIMRSLVQAKLKAHPELQDKLLATKNAHIEEDSAWDKFWGTGKSGPGGKGKNMMGKLLMELRESLRRHRAKHV